MKHNAKLVRVNFSPLGDEPAAIIVAFIDKNRGFDLIVKEAYSNWSADNNMPYTKENVDAAIKNSSYSFVGNIDLEEAYSDWEDFNILQFQKTKSYKLS